MGRVIGSKEIACILIKDYGQEQGSTTASGTAVEKAALDGNVSNNGCAWHISGIWEKPMS